MTYSHAVLRNILTSTRSIACVGLSPNPVRPSYFVGRYLVYRDYEVIPVHPAHAGETHFGGLVYPDLASIPPEISVDMVDIFRKPEHVPAVVDEALARFPELKVIWMQIGVEHVEAAAKAEARGVTVIQNRCPKIEYQRLFGELRIGGFNTGVISSKL